MAIPQAPALHLPALPARLTHAEAVDWLAAVRQAIERAPAGSDLRVDAGALSQFDSAAVAALLATRRLALGRGLALTVHRLPVRLQSLVALYGVAELLPA